MTEPPRPPGDGNTNDPTPYNPPSANEPAPGSMPSGYEPTSAPPSGYQPPPSYQQPPAGYQQPPSGYQPPPFNAPGSGAPGYPPPQGGFPPPQGGSAIPPGTNMFNQPGTPTAYANDDEKTWALVSHFGAIVFGFIAPLVALLTKGNESATVRAHAIESLNFQITWNAAFVVALIIAMCSFGFLGFLPLLVWLGWAVFSVIGGIRANEGSLYHYPLAIKLVN